MMNSEQPVSSGIPRWILVILLIVCLGAVGVVVYLAARPAESTQEIILATHAVASPQAAGINVSEVIDTIVDANATAVEGQRYKVLVVDNAREGAAGIARIGGLVTFVPGTQRGDLVVVEVTRMRRSTADSVVLERLESGVEVPGQPARARPAESSAAVISGLVGQVFRGTITDTGSGGDGVIRVEGKVVFVEGASAGEHVEFEITADAPRFANAKVIARSPVPYDEAMASSRSSSSAPQRNQDRILPVYLGQVLEVTVTEQDRRNPALDGVARIEGFVVFVPGTQPGDQVTVRIADVRARAANAEVIMMD